MKSSKGETVLSVLLGGALAVLIVALLLIVDVVIAAGFIKLGVNLIGFTLTLKQCIGISLIFKILFTPILSFNSNK